MCRPPSPAPCATIKANARLRRSRLRKDPSANATANPVVRPTVPNNDQRQTPKKSSRRQRRPAKKQQTHLAESCDASTASTAATSLSSLSENSSATLDANKQSKTQTSTRRRKHSKKSRTSRVHKIVHISAPELSEKEKARYVALDCEMVGIGPGGAQSRLARVCLVNWDGDTIYDTCVQVVETVTDYRTFVSGITAEDLRSDAATFDEAHAVVAAFLRDKIVIGHGLKNDFRVLALAHPWQAVRDTANYAPFMRAADPAGPSTPWGATHAPKKLKELARDKLGMVIQEEGRPHSPMDDAVAALELYKKHRGKWEKAVEWKVEKTRAMVAVCRDK